MAFQVSLLNFASGFPKSNRSYLIFYFFFSLLSEFLQVMFHRLQKEVKF